MQQTHCYCDNLQICDAGSLVPDNTASILGEAAARALEGNQKDNKATPDVSPERLKALQAILQVLYCFAFIVCV
jgi:hypothetical protein